MLTVNNTRVCVTVIVAMFLSPVASAEVTRLENKAIRVDVNNSTGCFTVTEKTTGQVWQPDPWGRPLGGTDHNQDRRPLRQETEVVGHAVFFTYVYAGAADAYLETGDKSLLTALDRLWHDLTEKKMYVTGGVSPMHKGLSSRRSGPGKRMISNDNTHEAAGMPYDLPSATAYNETCGQIGNMMWHWRTLTVTGDARGVLRRSIHAILARTSESAGDRPDCGNARCVGAAILVARVR